MWKRKQKFLFPNSVSQSHDPVIIVNSFLLISPSRNVSPHTTTYVKHLVYILTQIGSSYTQFCNFHFSLKIRSIYLDLYLPFSACIAGVPNPRAVDRYQSAACQEPGRTAGGEKQFKILCLFLEQGHLSFIVFPLPVILKNCFTGTISLFPFWICNIHTSPNYD